MTRTTHRYKLQGEILESDVFIGTEAEWAALADSCNPSWSVFRGPTTVVANRLRLPGEILRIFDSEGRQSDRISHGGVADAS